VNAALTLYRPHLCATILQRMKTTNRKTPTTWTLDPLDTTVAFSVRHFMITNVGGVFQTLSGTARYDADRPEASEIHVDIPAASLSTRDPERDAHLRSSHFFDADRHPTITFRSTRVRSVTPGALEIVGNLTLRGTTREIVLAVGELTREQKDHNGATRLGASARATIRRSDFGMTYNLVLDAGGIALSDDVRLTVDVSLVKDERAERERASYRQ
jgi:polyisoprenoid-binding protein YceI